MRLRVGVYNLYWSTMGGGEQVHGSIAQVLGEDHDVTVLGPQPVDVGLMRERLGIDLSHCDYRRVIDDVQASAASADYELFVNGTFFSRATCQAPFGYYYVNFPEVPQRRVDRLRTRTCVGAVKALSMPPRLPARLREVRAGFDRRIVRTDFIPSYTRYFAVSEFTAQWIQRLWNVPADVLYPPVRPTVAPGEKQPLILNLGRFFDSTHGHGKKQLELLQTFAELHRAGKLEGWRLALVGGCDAANREYALAVRRAAVGLPVDVHINATGARVQQLLAAASIYWHGAGYGADPQRQPEKFEHFGIAVVEAMAAGAVPVVFGAAGPSEIVRDRVDGFHWHELPELARLTTELAAAPDQRLALGASARLRAGDFSADAFASRLRAMLAADLGDQTGELAQIT